VGYADRVKLLFGPYAALRVRYGRRAVCEILGPDGLAGALTVPCLSWNKRKRAQAWQLGASEGG
jgi:hypothetical protein